MKTKISTRDWQALSAYLDGQLAQEESKRLEMRLQNEPHLQAALDELRRTRAFLRSQPRLRAPRNFMLTPQMAGVDRGRRAQPPAYPVLRLASSLAMIFFVVLLVGDLYLSAFGLAPALVSRETQRDAAQQMAPALGIGSGGGNDQGENLALPEAAPPPGAEAPEALEVGPAKEEPPMDVTLEKSLEATPVITMTATPSMTPSPPPSQPRPAPVLAAASGWPFLRFLQVALALLAVISGAAAFYLRRSARG